MSHARVSDLAILLGHTMQCQECRDKLLAEPERVVVGRKIPAVQRERLASLTNEDFESSILLANAVGMDTAELQDGMDHPRARLRHL